MYIFPNISLLIVNYAAINMGVQISLQCPVFISWEVHPEVGMLNHMVDHTIILNFMSPFTGVKNILTSL